MAMAGSMDEDAAQKPKLAVGGPVLLWFELMVFAAVVLVLSMVAQLLKYSVLAVASSDDISSRAYLASAFDMLEVPVSIYVLLRAYEGLVGPIR
jgi:hypothetical protein